MKRPARTAAIAPSLYVRIRQILDLYTKLLVVAKGHALRDEFGVVRKPAGAMNRKSKTALIMERDPIGYSLPSQLAPPQTAPEILDAPGQISDALCRKSMSVAPGSALSAIRHASRGEPWYSYYGLPGARRERAGHGR
jgi:hypothetical protein